MTSNNPTRIHREIRSFVRREGRLTRGQKQALQQLWPRYGLEPGELADPEGIFGRRAPLNLEIGFGNGASLASMAANARDEDFIGIEVHRPGVGHLLKELESNALTNVRIYKEDAVPVIRNSLPDACLDRVLLLFPDPWHKKRHHKRRIVQPDFIRLLAAKLKPGGILHMATDWQEYAEYMLEVLGSSPEFRNCSESGHYSTKPAYRQLTKFEQRGRKLGHGVWDLLFERVSEEKGNTGT